MSSHDAAAGDHLAQRQLKPRLVRCRILGGKLRRQPLLVISGQPDAGGFFQLVKESCIVRIVLAVAIQELKIGHLPISRDAQPSVPYYSGSAKRRS